ncbi:restriction of telomere capping protein 5 [Achaetomium macrosporum]|uniref:Restriction of telomere capping protein 5 n=1 Tax=Achaetomium macrosporum TaxID=79813 RepID=A0AAN7C756_9PEZI|nr:restriction of telomere capping protein 5 [Achaetomium macrosporum]
MGQAQSDGRSSAPSREEVRRELTERFAQQCFTPIELYSFKDVFNGLTRSEQHSRHLKEDTLAQFLEIPDILGVSVVLFRMVSRVATFPFVEDAPAVLSLGPMVMAVTILTGRYRRVLAGGAISRRKLLFTSLAVYDRELSGMRLAERENAAEENDWKEAGRDASAAPATTSPRELATDEPKGDKDSGLDNGNEDSDVDELVLAALDSLGYTSLFKHGRSPTIHSAMIPTDNWRKIIMLLLLIAPLEAQESLSAYSNRLARDELDNLRMTADCVLASFLDVAQAPGIEFSRFNRVIPASMPFIFSGFTALFEHFLFSKNLDFYRRKGEQPGPISLPPERAQPLLKETGSIMNLSVLSQISFFIPGSSLFRRLRLLYAGDEDGFSMGSFESKVFHWRAPTILLVSGTRLSDEPGHAHTGPASNFLAALPPQRAASGGDRDERLTFGIFLSSPWKHTHRECFGSNDTLLFQLQPIHDVFRASTVNNDYALFTKPSAPALLGGISFGCPPPQSTQAYRRSNVMSLGPVSLVLDDSFEFGCFTHSYSSQGGAFQTSVVRKFDFQDRFEISSIEVWGCGGDDEAKYQAEQWAWEAREAEARRRINLGTGDIEADRALLELAGLIGVHRGGGSMA